MDFGLSQDQEMLCDAISRTLADTCPLDHVRECAEGSVPFSDNVRSALGKESGQRIKDGQQVQGPAQVVHGDYTLTSAPQRLLQWCAQGAAHL